MTDHKSVAEPHVLEYKICNIVSYTLICLRNDANPSNRFNLLCAGFIQAQWNASIYTGGVPQIESTKGLIRQVLLFF
jgi:hypothetical protein